jgi:hypothetical protein
MAAMVDPQQRELGTAGGSFDCAAGDASEQWLSGKSRAVRGSDRAIWILITVALGAAAGTISFFALEGLVKTPAPSNGDLISFDLGCIQKHLRAHHPRHEDSSDMVVDCEVRGPGYGGGIGRDIRKFLVQSPRHLPKHPVRSTPPVEMGMFDFVTEQFKAKPTEEVLSEDRLTPFDRWRGVKTVGEEQKAAAKKNTIQFVDPNDASNYFSVALSKPMGISFVENRKNMEEGVIGVYIDSVLPDGSAKSASKELMTGDQLVGVDSTSVMGTNIDNVLEKIVAAPGPTTKLTFFRGPTMFLYGPTAPKPEFYSELLGSDS